SGRNPYGTSFGEGTWRFRRRRTRLCATNRARLWRACSTFVTSFGEGTWPFGRGAGVPRRLSGPQNGPAGAGQEARLDEERHRLRLRHGLAVEPLDREPLRPAAPHVRDERGERRAQPLLVGIAQRHQRPPAA